ncbi:hypothetical protein HZH68_001596 [Vespula germanica]|uniref:Uncharacterized protein n=1 Tax=Vespula germanica TaxID=30212 RepID=A0A834NVU1_VESGE|nr:hypothetical protein HZH68_001596 [Vespula germanica]
MPRDVEKRRRRKGREDEEEEEEEGGGEEEEEEEEEGEACAEGFTGLRCETKDVISTGSVYNRRRAPFSCKLGLSTSYYC